MAVWNKVKCIVKPLLSRWAFQRNMKLQLEKLEGKLQDQSNDDEKEENGQDGPCEEWMAHKIWLQKQNILHNVMNNDWCWSRLSWQWNKESYVNKGAGNTILASFPPAGNIKLIRSCVCHRIIDTYLENVLSVICVCVCVSCLLAGTKTPSSPDLARSELAGD